MLVFIHSTKEISIRYFKCENVLLIFVANTKKFDAQNSSNLVYTECTGIKVKM